jgi:hypothetical protein
MTSAGTKIHGRAPETPLRRLRGSSMHGERGQSVCVVVGVSIDVVVAVAEYGAAGRVDYTTIPRDHRMRDPNNGSRIRVKSDLTVSYH